MSLQEYQKKRNFRQTREPSGKSAHNTDKKQSIFVIQKHDASHLHYDFRLEVDGVLKSWAVPKGPSLDPTQKRLAMMVEDHPYSYRDFEGTIPEGSYGAGEVIVWDTGTYTVDDMDKDERETYMRTGITHGKIAFVLHGQKLQGRFALIKMHGKEDNAWLLVKELDDHVVKGADHFSPVSVLSDDLLSRDEEESDTPKNKTQQKSESSSKQPQLKKAKLPEFFTPMLATLVDKPFTEKGWIYENKLDGYRTLAFVEDGEVQLYSRNQISLNKKFPSIVKALESLPFQAVIDGEVIGVNDEGMISFQVLQNSQRNADQLYYYVFDLPFIEGQNIMQLPLTDRKKLLKKAVEGLPHVKFVEDFVDGEKLYQRAKEKGYEGIIAKRADSTYKPNVRGESWLKIKITKQQEAIICGYTSPKGSRLHFGSLILGVYQDDILHYVGHTGTGFPTKELESLKKVLDQRVIDHSPFSDASNLPDSDITWVRPDLVCEVKYAEWTEDNMLRQAVFERLRPDKDAKTVVIEKPAASRKAVKNADKQDERDTLHLSHPDKVYWPKLELTKKDMIEYYEQMAPIMLPYLKHRPQSLNRFPNGVDEPSFFQKDITFDVPDFVELITIPSDDAGDIHYMVCNNTETLLYMANLGCIEINPWNSRTESLDCPDYFVIDLDPVEVPFQTVVRVAREVKSILDEAKIKAFCKTSGKKGIHVFIPLHGQYETEISAAFAKLIATLTFERLPEITSLERSPSARRGKVYLDFLQNRKGQTLAAPYSLRPTPDATASAPLEWDELTDDLDPKQFTIKTLPKRVAKKGDVWSGLLSEKNNLKAALQRLQK